MSDSINKGKEYWKASQPIGNTFVNDGSFLEMFRKRMEENKTEAVNQPSYSRTETKKAEPKEIKTKNSEGASGQSDSSGGASGDKPIIQVLIGLCYSVLCRLQLSDVMWE